MLMVSLQSVLCDFSIKADVWDLTFFICVKFSFVLIFIDFSNICTITFCHWHSASSFLYQDVEDKRMLSALDKTLGGCIIRSHLHLYSY